MALPTNLRIYRLSDGDLALTATQILAAATRDAAELLPYNIVDADITAADDLLEAFLEVRSDQELSGMMKEATVIKNNYEKEKLAWVMKEIMSRVGMVYGADSPTYSRFGTNGIHNFTDGDLLIAFGRIARQANALATPLAAVGLNALMLTEADGLDNGYLSVWKAQNAAIDDRDQEVELRIGAGNTLYEVIARIANVGKAVWKGNSDAKYNDYVIYGSHGGGNNPVVAGPIAANELINVSTTGIIAGTMVTLMAEETDLVFGFAAGATDAPTTNQITVPAGTSVTKDVSEIGFLAGTRERFQVQNLTATDGKYRIEWEG